MYGILTEENNGSYDLPLKETFQRPKQVKVGNVVHPRQVWQLWTDAQLRAEGLCKIDDVTSVTEGHEKGSSIESTIMGNDDRVKITYATSEIDYTKPQAALRDRVNGMRDSKINAGITITIDATDYVLQTDQASRDNISGVVAGIGAALPLPLNADGTLNLDGTGTHIAWRMRDDTDVLMDADTFKASVGLAVMAHVNTCHLAARTHKAAIDALSTYADVSAYDLESGWPDVAPAEE
jgi:hypothetical protein